MSLLNDGLVNGNEGEVPVMALGTRGGITCNSVFVWIKHALYFMSSVFNTLVTRQSLDHHQGTEYKATPLMLSYSGNLERAPSIHPGPCACKEINVGGWCEGDD